LEVNMTTKELLFNEIEDAPEPVLAEVLDFVQFLKRKVRPGLETALASEAVLARDWLRPEEDEAWQNL
jgi:glutaredoxin 2